MTYPILVEYLDGDHALTIVCEACDAEQIIDIDDLLTEGLYRCPNSCGGIAIMKYEQADKCPGCGELGFYSRALVTAHLGRELRSDEIVHHINREPTDDGIENLRVTTRAEHLAIHRLELAAARVTAKTHCPHGHPYDDENTYRDSANRRHCRACGRRNSREYQTRKAAA